MFGFGKRASDAAPETGFFSRLKAGLSRTRATLANSLGSLLLGKKAIDQALLDELETRLLTADVGVKATASILAELTAKLKRNELADSDALYAALKQQLQTMLQPCEAPLAIPANMVRVVVASAQTGGTAVKRPWLGAKLQAVTPDIAEKFDLKRPAGAVVTTVTAKSPAARAGLKTGDVIVAVDGQGIDDPNAFDYRFATRQLGSQVPVTIMRGGKEARVNVALETAPDSARDEISITGRSPLQGLKVANLSPALADEMRIETSLTGVVVTDVPDGTPGQSVGFQKGDILVSVNGTRIEKTADLDKLTKAGSRMWRITINRGGQEVSAVFGG